MIGLLNESDWKIQKREPYQKYKDYEILGIKIEKGSLYVTVKN